MGAKKYQESPKQGAPINPMTEMATGEIESSDGQHNRPTLRRSLEIRVAESRQRFDATSPQSRGFWLRAKHHRAFNAVNSMVCRILMFLHHIRHIIYHMRHSIYYIPWALVIASEQVRPLPWHRTPRSSSSGSAIGKRPGVVVRRLQDPGLSDWVQVSYSQCIDPYLPGKPSSLR